MAVARRVAAKFHVTRASTVEAFPGLRFAVCGGEKALSSGRVVPDAHAHLAFV